MDMAEVEALRERLDTLVRERWSLRDPDVQVSSALREDHKIDMRVVSHLFEGRDGLEREALFYPVFDPVPQDRHAAHDVLPVLTPRRPRSFALPGQRTGENNTDTWA